ncbi:MAG TPA: hypothetical protein ENJ95_05455, partial [Bacteroidetes bacterium]|nr:hypothetical protein [Bacteroidota bacterium]
QKEKSGEKLLLEAKLILLGDGRAGKTSLANRLLKKPLPTEKDRTEGVDIIIGKYEFPVANNEVFKLHIWDFAGQDKYKPLHQFFYTESSLYVMVADSGNPKTDFDDWMQTAELFGEGSPMVLVLNEFKEGMGRGSFDEGHWRKQFPNLLKEVFLVNLGTKKNFKELEHHIRLLAQTLPHTQHIYPKNWADIRSELESREEQYISLKEYFGICEGHGLPEENSALILSSVLHKIGVCLHYQKNPLLEQFIILKNEWATEAVYKILKDKEVGENKCGFFNHADLERIWSEKEYRYMRPQLLALMQQFKMAYPLPGNQEFVTPYLLPIGRKAGWEWPEAEALELYIEYDFLPKALFTQFIVSRHKDIDEGRTLVWRNGVVLRWPGEALAEITRSKLQGKNAFYIRSQGRNRKGMMTVVLKTFRELHAEYKGIKTKEKVPCNCAGCKSGENNQHYYDYKNLKKRLEHNRSLDCDESFAEINILQLLENYFIFEKIQRGRPLTLKEKVEYTPPPETKTLKLFLASSAELKEERNEIEIAIGRKNKILRKQNIFIDLMIWEDGKFIGNSFRSQDNYNLEIDECDYFVLLFYSKVGKFTKEEYERAKKRFDENGVPRIKIYQKNIDLPADLSRRDFNSRKDFMDELNEEEHFPEKYKNTDGLVRSLEKDIDKLL